MELIATYSITEIITFLIVLGSSLVGFLKFCSFIWGYISKFLQMYVKKQKDEEAQEETVDELLETVRRIDKKISSLEQKVQILEDSDKDDIKSYITDKYHYLVYHQGWVDDYAFQSIEARYKHYIDEGGNSFIASLMDEIRKLPKEPPSKEDEEV